MTTELKEAPASACRFTGGPVEFAASTDGGKTIPIRMMARSAQPIEHWFWGRVVHDMAGMQLHKDVIPIDYEHGEPIGFLNQNQASDKGLVCAGGLVPTEEPGDRVRRITQLSDGGVPYEASINFFGDGIKLEVLGEDQVAEVNGYTFEGPGVIIREWPLRGVAVCAYGADMHTESKFSQGDETISLTTISEHQAMSKDPKKLSTEAAPVAENKPVEKPVEEQKPAAEPKAEEKPAEEPKPAPAEAPAAATSLSEVRAEAKRFRTHFGDKGAVWFSEGLTFEEAQARQTSEMSASVKTLTDENVELKKKLALAQGEQGPVSFEAPGEQKKRAGFSGKIKLR